MEYKCKYNRNSNIRNKNTFDERNKLICDYRINQNRTLQEIGHIYGLTRERVRQILEEKGIVRNRLDKQKNKV